MTRYESNKAWAAANKEKVKEFKKKWKANNPEKMKAIARRAYVKHKAYYNAKSRAYYAAHKKEINAYGTIWNRERREALRLAKAGRARPSYCELCGESCRPRFDHCHAKGHFRGWICGRCNLVLGSVKDSVELLGKMIAYLQKSKEKAA